MRKVIIDHSQRERIRNCFSYKWAMFWLCAGYVLAKYLRDQRTAAAYSEQITKTKARPERLFFND